MAPLGTRKPHAHIIVCGETGATARPARPGQQGGASVKHAQEFAACHDETVCLWSAIGCVRCGRDTCSYEAQLRLSVFACGAPLYTSSLDEGEQRRKVYMDKSG